MARFQRLFGGNPAVATGPDGRFQLARLAAGSYTLVAERRSGGEARVEHVAAGGAATLRIPPAASIAGTVRRDGGAPDLLEIELSCGASVHRDEQFFHTGGVYAIGELPAGPCDLELRVDGGVTSQTVELAEGEHKCGVDVELSSRVTLTGRVVDLVTHAPVPAIRMRSSPGASPEDDDGANVTGADGRFVIRHAPGGQVSVLGMSAAPGRDEDYDEINTTLTVSGTGTIDLGDLPIERRTDAADEDLPRQQ
jgi:hypothetical protein